MASPASPLGPVGRAPPPIVDAGVSVAARPDQDMSHITQMVFQLDEEVAAPGPEAMPLPHPGHHQQASASNSRRSSLGGTTPVGAPSRKGSSSTIPRASSSSAWSVQPYACGQTIVGASNTAYILVKLLGVRPGFGEVWKAFCETPEDRIVCVKFLRSDLNPRSLEHEVLNAVAVQQLDVQSPHLLQPLDTCISPRPGRSFIVSESGPLHITLARCLPQRPLPEAVTRTIARQICSGLVALHEGGVAHGALSLECMLIDKSFRVKLCDLGVSDPRAAAAALRAVDPVYGVGMAPELLFRPQRPEDPSSLRAADVWSCALLIVTLATGKPPFSLAAGVDAYVESLQRNPEFSRIVCDGLDLPTDLQDMLHGMLLTDPTRRPSMASVLASAWFAGEDCGSDALAEHIVLDGHDIMTPRSPQSLEALNDVFASQPANGLRGSIGNHELTGLHQQHLGGQQPLPGEYRSPNSVLEAVPAMAPWQGPMGAGPGSLPGSSGFSSATDPMVTPAPRRDFQHRPQHFPGPPGPNGPRRWHNHPGPGGGGGGAAPGGPGGPGGAGMGPPPPPHMPLRQQGRHHRGVARPICKYTLNGGSCQAPNCEFFHPPGTRLPPSRSFRQQTPRPRPGPGYVCHNCGDSTLSHFKADCPHPQRCRYTTHGGVCSRPICPFFHPPGTRMAPGPAAAHNMAGPPMPRPRPGPGYVCHNCGDSTLSHFKADCPHPQRCRYTTHGGVCNRNQCQFFHPQDAYGPY